MTLPVRPGLIAAATALAASVERIGVGHLGVEDALDCQPLDRPQHAEQLERRLQRHPVRQQEARHVRDRHHQVATGYLQRAVGKRTVDDQPPIESETAHYVAGELASDTIECVADTATAGNPRHFGNEVLVIGLDHRVGAQGRQRRRIGARAHDADGAEAIAPAHANDALAERGSGCGDENPAAPAHLQDLANHHVRRDRIDEEHGRLLVRNAVGHCDGPLRIHDRVLLPGSVRRAARDRDAPAAQTPREESFAARIDHADALPAERVRRFRAGIRPVRIEIHA